MTRWRAPVAAVAALAAALLGAAPVWADDARVAPASVGPDGRLSVALIAPVTVPVASPGLLTADQLTRFTAPDGLLTQELDSVLSQPAVTLAVDPRIIASIRVLGGAAPESASAWLDRLAGAPNKTFPLLYADADPLLAGQAGLALDLTPLDFTYAIDPQAFGSPTPTPTPSASTTAVPGAEPPLPQSPAEVLAWDWQLDGIVWPAANTVAAADLPRLAAAGYRTVLLSDGNVSGPAGHVSLRNPGVPRSLTGLVIDSELSAAASAVADSDSPGAELALAGLAAATRAVAADSRGATRVVALPRSASSSLRFLPAAVQTMQAAGATPVPLSAALGAAPEPATVVERAEPAERLAAIPSVVAAIAEEDAFSSVAVEPLAIRGPRRIDLLALMSTGWVGDAAWQAAVRRFLDRSEALRSSVTLATPSRYFAPGANPPLPVTVKNGLGTAIRVYAIVRPLRSALSIPPDKRRIAIAVQPESTSTVRIPTQSVANGRVKVQVRLVSTSGVAVDAPTTLTVDVQAGWETIGTLIAVVLVLGVFGFGVTRNILRRRAERRRGADARG